MNSKVTLDVGGVQFSTTLQTLRKYEDSMLARMLGMNGCKQIHQQLNPFSSTETENYSELFSVFYETGVQLFCLRIQRNCFV